MILFLTNADTEILAVRSVVEALPEALGEIQCVNPARYGDLADLARNASVVILRLLGGRSSWEAGFDELRRVCTESAVPLLAFGGEADFDAELAQYSDVEEELMVEAFAYLRHGGPANLENLLCFVGDRVLGLGLGYQPAREVPVCGLLDDDEGTRSSLLDRESGGSSEAEPEIGQHRPRVAVIFYRAQYVSGNVAPIRELCAAIEAAGGCAVPLYCYSLRGESGKMALEMLRALAIDCLVTTVWAAGSASDSGDAWEVSELASLGVPVVQAIAATCSTESWEQSAVGLPPPDVAMSVAIPEFDGRIISVPFSFKVVVDDGESLGAPVVAHRSVSDRVERVAQIAVSHARLRHLRTEDKRIALVLSAYPTKKSRLGNAVGLDTPASAVKLLGTMRAMGYALERIPETGDELMEKLSRGLLYDRDAPVAAEADMGLLDIEAYRRWFSGLDKTLRDRVVEAWGEPPGDLFRVGRALAFSGLDLSQSEGQGGVFVAIQPPRGFGENPVAIYHSPDLPPTHHYLAFYRWLSAPLQEGGWACDAIVHLGKHGTLEWLPGKGIGLSQGCFSDAALANVPLVYPFVVNDPGEGAQAKRRAHAVIVDHLVPPMTRAESYGDLSSIESILDEHSRLLALDPPKLPAVRAQLWEAVVAAEMHRDLGIAHLEERGDFEQDSFDDLVGELDGYLCELKDAQIRGGLHVLGEAPEGEALVDMVLAVTRVAQGGVASLRDTISAELDLDVGSKSRVVIDRVESECRKRVEALADRGWKAVEGDPDVLNWIANTLLPALRSTGAEIDAILTALSGGFVPPGPSGAPTRGMAHVLPTGRNFYTIDPRAIPSRLSWEVGCSLAEGLVSRYLREEGRYPESVGLVVWGTATMRTAGDDLAEALALLGVEPVWDAESGRVSGLSLVDLATLGRPRVGVTLRISGFFRDAFSHLIALFEEAVEMVASAGEDTERNPLAGERRRGEGGDPRVFGPKPGGYGSGILPLIESGEWEDDADLAAVYLTWSGWAYGSEGEGYEALDAARRRLASIEVAVKNQDNREHDIFDSDDYLQDHGGMIATIRALSGKDPKAYFGDSSDPARARMRSLNEESARVMRSRVLNPRWLEAMRRHGYKGAFEMAATVDYVFGYDATARVAEDWMYEKITERYVADREVRAFFRRSNPHALRSIAERLLEASQRGMWKASENALEVLAGALLESEGWEEGG